MLGESQLSEVTSNLSFHISVPVSPLLKSKKFLETSRYMLQTKSAMVVKQNFSCLFQILKGVCGILGEFGSL